MDLKTLSDLPPWDWPADAGATLLSVLQSEETGDADRLLAVELASSTMSDGLAETLLAIVRDPGQSDVIRGAAAISLGPTLEELEWYGESDPDDRPVSEGVERAIRDCLRDVHRDAGVPKEVRRRALEASVRSSEEWHADAVRKAYASGDDEWKRTAVFCMSFVPGFDSEILEALESGDPDLQYEAVKAAGSWAVDAAWPHIRTLVQAEATDRDLLLAAIDAVPSIRPEEAAETLADLAHVDDEEIDAAVLEALAMAKALRDATDEPD